MLSMMSQFKFIHAPDVVSSQLMLPSCPGMPGFNVQLYFTLETIIENELFVLIMNYIP